MKKNPTIPELIWQFFCSIKLTIYTLVLLATTSVFGTVILQNGTPQQYIRLYGQGFYNLIKIFSIDDMYHSGWFLALILILCINIIVCSIDRLSASWKIIFPKKIKFNPDRFRKMKNLQTVDIDQPFDSLLSRCKSQLSKSAGTVIEKETDTGMALYAEKGRWTRLGVYIVHTSVLLLSIGALIGAVFGFKAFLNLDEGTQSHTVFLSKSHIPHELDFEIRCDDFDVKFYDTGAPDDFRSTLTVIENGKEVLTRDIRVNHPLRYNGINIFQSSYGASKSVRQAPDHAVIEVLDRETGAVRDQHLHVGETMPLPDGRTFLLEKFVSDYDFRGNSLGQAFVGKITDNAGKSIEIGMPLRFPSFDRMRKGSLALMVKEFEQSYFTGLQVTKDPGVWYVYAGFILMIIGCWITFFMAHQSVYIEIEKKAQAGCVLKISGTTNRNHQGLKLKLNSILNKIKG